MKFEENCKRNKMERVKLDIIYALFIEDNININALSKRISADYKNTYNAVKKLFLSGMIKITRIGNSKILTLNYQNDAVPHYLSLANTLSLIEYKKTHPMIYARIKAKIKKLFKINPFFIYAVDKKGKHIVITFLDDQQEIKLIPKDALIFLGDGIFYSWEKWN